MKFIPILMSTLMVQAEKAGRKTMTRRTKGLEKINESPDEVEFLRFQEYPDGSIRAIFQHKDADDPGSIKCPYGKVGDVLWVRETFRKYWVTDPETGEPDFNHVVIDFAADPNDMIPMIDGDGFQMFNKDGSEKMIPWSPGIHMPKAACRTFLEITDIRVERLHDISEEDAEAEGVQKGIFRMGPNTLKKQFQLETSCKGSPIGTYYDGFKFIWWQINGPESWHPNPWVWVITFKRIERPENFFQ